MFDNRPTLKQQHKHNSLSAEGQTHTFVSFSQVYHKVYIRFLDFRKSKTNKEQKKNIYFSSSQSEPLKMTMTWIGRLKIRDPVSVWTALGTSPQELWRLLRGSNRPAGRRQAFGCISASALPEGWGGWGRTGWVGGVGALPRAQECWGWHRALGSRGTWPALGFYCLPATA